MVLLADRFLADRGAWTDVATGLRVNLRVIKPSEVEGPALKGGDQFGWADRCATLSLLRHPLINPLLDYGSCDASHLFEAYAANAPVCANGVPAARLLAHAAEFLETSGVPVAPGQASLLLREVTAGPSLKGRPIGLVLQKRAALDAVIDALDAQTPAGAVHLAVTGPPGSGLTTLQTLVAREARLRGYVAVCVNVLARFPSIVELLPARHVCLIVEEPLTDQGQRLLAAVVARLGAASARRHVVVRFHRATSWVSSTVLLDRLGAAAMTGMVFVDREMGPSAGELFEAARASDGRPGAFLRALRAVAFPPHESRHGVVHETAPRYETSADPGVTSKPEDMVGRASVRRVALANAGSRAEALAKAGRHAAACRLLVRAGRVQERRNDPAAAARCAYTLAWILRARGRSERAVESFDRCATLAGNAPLAISAVVGRGVVQTDEGRLVEAEATLRGATVAAQSIGDEATHRAAVLALARTLLWQGRHDESSSLLAAMAPAADDEPLAVEAWALTARLRLAQGDVRAALDAARRAVDLAERLQDGRRTATAHRAMAAVLANLGDETAAREHVGMGLRGARAAHLPLAAVRLRLVFGARGTPGHYGVSPVNPAGGAAAAGIRAMLPRLLDAQVKAAAGIDVADVVRDTGARALLTSGEHRGPFAHVEALLEMSHAAPDDRSALERICAHVCSELRACTVVVVTSAEGPEVVASAGKPWHGDMKAGAQALGSGRGVHPDPLRQPQQAAEPVRFGGRVIAALACRWTAGTSVNPGVTELLRAGALAAAASVRAVLDARPASGDQQPAARELLGESAAAIGLRDAITRAARAPFPVLVEGESGSGKELVARAIHRLGPRRDRRWCAVNCAAITDDLLEAELFGHARGAFTGAAGERAGLFEEADGGTLFLDEVGDLSPRAQAKLLRVLQDGEVRRVGENLPRRVDVRVVAATNHRLEDDAAAGRFRGDLRFRLDVVRIVVPPLRERVADIPLLAGHFWRTASAQVGSSAALAPETLAALARYDWPGNVRELQNVIAWMAVHSPRRGRVGPSSLPAQLAQATAPSAGTFEVAREEFERRFVRAALARAGGHRSRAADALGISRQGLAKMLRRLNIDPP